MRSESVLSNSFSIHLFLVFFVFFLLANVLNTLTAQKKPGLNRVVNVRLDMVFQHGGLKMCCEGGKDKKG